MSIIENNQSETMIEDPETPPSKNINEESNTLLYTQKYSPKHYSDLLTEEKINREILTWMKSWDEIVFNKTFNIPKIAIPNNNNFNKQQSSNTKYKKKGLGLKNENNNESKISFKYIDPEYIRQKHKIILIGGPPGVGKTTLAKVVAKQCGYEPIIVNASDERTAEKLILRIYNTTLLHNLTSLRQKKELKKPTCLILDEIDGISSNNAKKSIKTIIDFIKYGQVNKKILENNKKEIFDEINAMGDNIIKNGGNVNFIKNNKNNKKSRKKNKNNENDDKTSSDEENITDIDNNNNDEESEKINYKKNKNNSNEGAKRPIICICNDLYAKQLSLLRKEALVYNIKKIDEKKMFDLLVSITKKEKLPIDKITIKNICDLSNNDIRTSLLCLQFFHYNRKNNILISEIIHDKEKLKYICNKDFNENLFNVWNKLFYRFNISDENNLNYIDIKKLYDSCGEHKKIYEGLFNNYLKIPNRDCGSLEDIEKRSELSDIFSYEDYIQGKGFNIMPGSVDNYINFSGTYINKYYYCKKFDKNLIEYTSLFYDYRFKTNNYKNIIETIQENIYDKMHILYKKEELISIILPYLYKMMTPQFREINFELLNKNEKECIDTAINVMFYCGIDMKESTQQENNTTKIYFEPNIKKLVTFEGVQEEDDENLDNKSEITINANTNSRMYIIMGEYEKRKNLSLLVDEKIQKEKESKELKENAENYNNNFQILLNNMGVGKKRKFNESKKCDSKFIYRFHEGKTDCVRRPLNISYFEFDDKKNK